MTTLYLSGPMTGYPEHNVPAFLAAAARLRGAGAGYVVLSPTDNERDNPTPGTPQSWDWYLRRDLRMVTEADGLALLPEWQSSAGAVLEVHVAQALRIPCLPLALWLA
jgi:hypothetical protein